VSASSLVQVLSDPVNVSGYAVASPHYEKFRSLIQQSFSSDSRLAALANTIINSSWFQNEAMEPAVETTDEVVKEKIVRPGESRFRAFLEMTPTRTYRCQFVTEKGRCDRTEERLDRAQGHARQHFDYRPFVCGGKCARPDWSVLISRYVRSLFSDLRLLQ